MYSLSVKPRFDSVHDECGVFGIYSQDNKGLAFSVYLGLYALQHRGQDAAGIAVTSNNKIELHKGLGLVNEVFNGGLDFFSEGDIALGHVRYATASKNSHINAQPLVFRAKAGKIAIAFNGNIINAAELKKALIDDGVLFQTSTDTEVIAALINKHTKDDIVEGVIKAAKLLEGSFSFVLMTTTKLIAVRDSKGITPLVIGMVDDDYIVSSESCGIDAVGGELMRDVEPGEVVIIDITGIKSRSIGKAKKSASCVFEYVYLARQDSVIDGCSVYQERMKAGALLAKYYPVDADIVAGVPDSAVVCGRGYAAEANLPYVEVLNKNRYIGRTFIQPTQALRENSLRIKLNAIKSNVSGKRIVLLDDSIVRGTTCKKIIRLLKESGAKEVHVRITSPIVKYPCYFGVDIQTSSQLVGATKSKQEICAYIGADSLEFLSTEQLAEAVSDAKNDLCMACFDGKYCCDITNKQANIKKD